MAQRHYGDDRAKERRRYREMRRASAAQAGTAPAQGKKRPNRGVGNAARWAVEMRGQPCHYCGEPGGTIDHKVPRSQGGRTVQGNCVPACGPCNSFRGTMPYEEFKAFGWKQRAFA